MTELLFLILLFHCCFFVVTAVIIACGRSVRSTLSCATVPYGHNGNMVTIVGREYSDTFLSQMIPGARWHGKHYAPVLAHHEREKCHSLPRSSAFWTQGGCMEDSQSFKLRIFDFRVQSYKKS